MTKTKPKKRRVGSCQTDSKTLSPLVDWLDHPEANPGPWSAYTLGFESWMIGRWYGLIFDSVIEVPNLFDGIPNCAIELLKALEFLKSSASPDIVNEIKQSIDYLLNVNRQFQRAIYENEIINIDTEKIERIIPRMPGLADSILPGSHPLSRMYTLGRILAQHFHDPAESKQEYFTTFSEVLDNVVHVEEIIIRDVPALQIWKELAEVVTLPRRELELRERHFSKLYREGKVAKQAEMDIESVISFPNEATAVGWPSETRKTSPGIRSTLPAPVIPSKQQDVVRKLRELLSEIDQGQISLQIRDIAWMREIWQFHSRIQNELRQLRMKPHWDADNCTLSFNGQIIREVAPQAKNIKKILEAFELGNWAKAIKMKFASITHKGDDIESLNKFIEDSLIVFKGGGKMDWIRWDVNTDRKSRIQRLPRTS